MDIRKRDNYNMWSGIEICENRIWRVRELADYLKVSVQHVYNMVSKKQIPFKKKRGMLFFLPCEIENWLLEGDNYEKGRLK